TGSDIWADAASCATEARDTLDSIRGSLASTPVMEEAAPPINRSWWWRLLDWFSGSSRGATKNEPIPPYVGVDPTNYLWASHKGLDDDQKTAVSEHDGVLQILAPAGSGKT